MASRKNDVGSLALYRRGQRLELQLAFDDSTAVVPSTVRFGSVKIDAAAPPPEEVARNIKRGQFALKRANGVLVKHGVKLNLREDVPRFHADPTSPERVVRVWRGKRTIGVFVNGVFKPRR